MSRIDDLSKALSLHSDVGSISENRMQIGLSPLELGFATKIISLDNWGETGDDGEDYSDHEIEIALIEARDRGLNNTKESMMAMNEVLFFGEGKVKKDSCGCFFIETKKDKYNCFGVIKDENICGQNGGNAIRETSEWRKILTQSLHSIEKNASIHFFSF